jgi:hypothetical protein
MAGTFVMQPTTLERTHSNGKVSWVRKWPTSYDFGVIPAPSPGAIGTASVYQRQTLQEAKNAADRLAHHACDTRCGEWELRDR